VGYFADLDADSRSPYEKSQADVTCTCGYNFKIEICSSPGYNSQETYNCPKCGYEFSVHCHSVYILKG